MSVNKIISNVKVFYRVTKTHLIILLDFKSRKLTLFNEQIVLKPQALIRKLRFSHKFITFKKFSVLLLTSQRPAPGMRAARSKTRFTEGRTLFLTKELLKIIQIGCI